MPLQYCHSAVVAKALRSARSFRDEGVLRYVLYLRLLVFRLSKVNGGTEYSTEYRTGEPAAEP